MGKTMSPAEAADWVENSGPIHVTAKAAAVRILMDHARATDPALITALADEAHAIARDLSGPGIVSRAKADDIAERAAALAVALTVRHADSEDPQVMKMPKNWDAVRKAVLDRDEPECTVDHQYSEAQTFRGDGPSIVALPLEDHDA